MPRPEIQREEGEHGLVALLQNTCCMAVAAPAVVHAGEMSLHSVSFLSVCCSHIRSRFSSASGSSKGREWEPMVDCSSSGPPPSPRMLCKIRCIFTQYVLCIRNSACSVLRTSSCVVFALLIRGRPTASRQQAANTYTGPHRPHP